MDFLFGAFAALLAAPVAIAQQSSGNASIDPEHIFLKEPVKSPVTFIMEPVNGSNIPVEIIYVETPDGLYASIGLRKPPGNGPFPIILFAHMNGGLGVQWSASHCCHGSSLHATDTITRQHASPLQNAN